MYKHLFLIILLFLLTSGLVKSQKYDFDDDDDTKVPDKNNYGMIVKIAPFPVYWGTIPLTGEYGVALEKKTGLKNSFEFKAAYIGKGLLFSMLAESDTSFAGYNDLSIRGFRLQINYRFYINYASKGMFVAPVFSYANVKFSNAYNPASPYNIKAQHFDYSAVLGYQFIWGRFAMDIFGGFTYRQRYWIDNSQGKNKPLTEQEMNDMYIWASPFRPKLGFLVGFTL